MITNIISLLSKFGGKLNQFTNVICVGNSVTYGDTLDGRQPSANYATDNYPAQLQVLLGGNYAVYNHGHNGQDVDYLIAHGSSEDALFDSTKNNVIVFWEGTNQLFHWIRGSFVGGTDYSSNGSGAPMVQSGAPAAIWVKYQNYIAARKTAGFKVFVCTTPAYFIAPDLSNVTTASSLVDSGLPNWLDTNRIALNTLVRNNWASVCDGLIDLAAVAPFDTLAHSLAETNASAGVGSAVIGVHYYKDSVHLTPAGYLLEAQTVFNVVR